MSDLSTDRAGIVEAAPAISNRVLARTRQRVRSSDFIHDKVAVPAR